MVTSSVTPAVTCPSKLSVPAIAVSASEGMGGAAEAMDREQEQQNEKWFHDQGTRYFLGDGCTFCSSFCCSCRSS